MAEEETTVSVSVEGMEKLENAIGRMSNMQDTLNNIISKMKGALSNLDTSLGAGLDTAGESLETLGAGVRGLVSDLQQVNGETFVSTLITGIDQASAAARNFGDTVIGMMDGLANETGRVGDLFKALIPLGAAELQLAALEKIPQGFHTIEESVKRVQLQALQARMAFGDMVQEAATFEQAESSVGAFNRAMAASIITTRSTQEEVMNVSRTLQRSMGIQATMPIALLQESMAGLRSQITATNAALLISKATGTDNGTITNMMSQAYGELGMNLDDVVSMFGSIQDAAKRSGLGFDTTANSIFGMAKELKFWGTTVDSINPLFKTFSDSMQGIGRRGLTPDLLREFVGGLQSMSFGARALIGLQAGGRAATGGALGAGLRMEEALEKGDFQTISENLIATIKQFGGQQILTRQQALEAPGLEREFMVQRGLIQRLIGVSDPAKQNLYLQALQDIDQKGFEKAGDTVKTLGDLLKSGEQASEDTTTRLEKGLLGVKAAILTSGDELMSTMQDIFRGTELQGVFQGVQQTVENMSMTGRVDFDALRKQLRSTNTERVVTEQMIEEGGLSEGARQSLQEQVDKLMEEERVIQAQIDAARAVEGGVRSIADIIPNIKDIFSGKEKVITKEEVAADPRLEKDYTAQKMLLEQFLGSKRDGFDVDNVMREIQNFQEVLDLQTQMALDRDLADKTGALPAYELPDSILSLSESLKEQGAALTPPAAIQQLTASNKIDLSTKESATKGRSKEQEVILKVKAELIDGSLVIRQIGDAVIRRMLDGELSRYTNTDDRSS